MKKKYVSLEHTIRNAVRDQQYTKKTLNEDFEFEMARNELRTAIDAAKRLMSHLDGEGELEAWVQSKITKGADYLDTVADYMDSRDAKKLKEHTEELMEALSIIGGQFKGNQFQGGSPVISPGHTRAALKTSSNRKAVKQEKSMTIHGKVVESKKDDDEEEDDDSLLTKGIDIATDLIPGISNAKSAASAYQNIKAGNYGKAALDAALALPGVGNVGKAVGAGVKAIKIGTKINKKTTEPVAQKPTSDNIQSPASLNKGKEAPSSGANDNVTAPKIEKPKETKTELPTTKGEKKAANDDVEPEVKGTGTTGPAPKPKLKEPEQIKEPKPFELPKVDMPKPDSGANINKPSTAPKPSFKPVEPPKVDMPKPDSGANKNIPTPSKAPEPAPSKTPEPNPSKAPEEAPKLATSPEPAAQPSQAKSPAEPAPVPKPKQEKNNKPKQKTGFKLPSFRGKVKEPPAHSEFHSVPVKVSVGKASQHRTFKEDTGPDNTRRKDSSKELVGRPDSAGVKDPKSVLARNASIKTKIIDEEKKLAGVVRSVIKKKKEEKEGGPNPLVDFEPKLNHKYDNEN